MAIDFRAACINKASACAIGLAHRRDGMMPVTFYFLMKSSAEMEINPWFASKNHDIEAITCIGI